MELVGAGRSKPGKKRSDESLQVTFVASLGVFRPCPTNSPWASEDVLITVIEFITLLSEG